MKWPLRLTGHVRIFCHGAEITEDDLFQYTNGRFLINDNYQLARRRVKFNLSNLCNEAAAVANGSPVQRISKMEGGFSKALLLTMENGKELVAKIPCPNAGRAIYSTASEAAVLQYVNTHTQIPTPKLLAWNADATNPVGAEYIIMEKAPGVQLHTVWNDLSGVDRMNLIKNLTQLENQLVTIQFPAFGSLYHRQSIPDPSRQVLLDSSIDPAGLFCVGPACGPAWTDGTTPADLDPSLDVGPWSDLHQFGLALAKRSTARTRLPTNSHMPSDLHGLAEEHADIREMAMKLLPKLAEIPSLQQNANPTLWHTDMHMGNIFVSEQDHSQIVSLIDWQHTSVSPLILQARWPVFLSPPDGYVPGPHLMTLTEEYESFDTDEKRLAMSEKKQADAAKIYEVATYKWNHEAYAALCEVSEPLREFFRRIGDTWDDGIVPLQTCLVKIREIWSALGFSDPCPLDFSTEDIDTFKQRSIEYKRWRRVQDLATKYLQTDDEGWIDPRRDFEVTKEQNKFLLETLVGCGESQEEAEESRRMWPFPI
ncbi:MAG: hypothetical protein Q9221_009104 [Calogaya cf. arnoldii]